MSIISIYLSLLDKCKQNFKHSITISYQLCFILYIFLPLKSLSKRCLCSIYLSIVPFTKVLIIILLIIQIFKFSIIFIIFIIFYSIIFIGWICYFI